MLIERAALQSTGGKKRSRMLASCCVDHVADAMLKAEIYSYSRSRGLFAGLSLDGDVLHIDRRSNEDYYSAPGATAADVLTGRKIVIPPSSGKLQAGLWKLEGAVPAAPPEVVVPVPAPPPPIRQ